MKITLVTNYDAVAIVFLRFDDASITDDQASLALALQATPILFAILLLTLLAKSTVHIA